MNNVKCIQIEIDFFKNIVFKLIDRFATILCDESSIKILENLIDASYSQNILNFLDQLTTFYYKTQDLKSLFFIFKNIVLQKMLNKLTCSKYFNETLDILKRYLFGTILLFFNLILIQAFLHFILCHMTKQTLYYETTE